MLDMVKVFQDANIRLFSRAQTPGLFCFFDVIVKHRLLRESTLHQPPPHLPSSVFHPKMSKYLICRNGFIMGRFGLCNIGLPLDALRFIHSSRGGISRETFSRLVIAPSILLNLPKVHRGDTNKTPCYAKKTKQLPHESLPGFTPK